MAKYEYVRYDELKKGDVIILGGARVRIVDVGVTKEAPSNEWYPNDCTIYFTVEPADEEAVEMIGDFYSHGTYGGVGCLTIARG